MKSACLILVSLFTLCGCADRKKIETNESHQIISDTALNELNKDTEARVNMDTSGTDLKDLHAAVERSLGDRRLAAVVINDIIRTTSHLGNWIEGEDNVDELMVINNLRRALTTSKDFDVHSVERDKNPKQALLLRMISQYGPLGGHFLADVNLAEVWKAPVSFSSTKNPQPKIAPDPVSAEYQSIVNLLAKPNASPAGRKALEDAIADSLTRHGNEIEQVLRRKIFDNRGVVEDPLMTIRLLNRLLRKRSGKDGARRIWLHNFGAQMGSLFDSIPERAESAGLPPL